MLLTFSGGADGGGGGVDGLGLAANPIAFDSDIDKRVSQRNEVINTNTKNDLENLFPFK
jgi:hypothetical protein